MLNDGESKSEDKKEESTKDEDITVGAESESAVPGRPDAASKRESGTDKSSSSDADVPETGHSTERNEPPAPQAGNLDAAHTGGKEEEKEKEISYRENPMSDEERAYINVWMQTEDEGKQQDAEVEKEEEYDDVFQAVSKRFGQFKHHHFVDGEWKLYSDSDEKGDKKDEEWFIPATAAVVLDQHDPGYLCAMCRQIDFGVLFTVRGVTGNNNPGDAVIELKTAGWTLNESNRCAFCSLVRRSLQDRCTPNEIQTARESKDQDVRLAVLDDGPEYALRLQVTLGELKPRVVVQMLARAPERLGGAAATPTPLQGLLVSQDTADMERLRGWVRTCEGEHHQHSGDVVTRRAEPIIPPGPSSLRVIDVDEGRIVTVDNATTPCRYACLSYVWGNETGTQLTTKTRPVLESAGGLNDTSVTLGQTLRDAVKVTKDLGLRYLWIDALCILQDDDDDKADIISRMSAIYGHAVVTIIASTNTRPAEGLPGVGSVPRSRAQVVSQVQGNSLAAAMHDVRLPYGEIEDSVWNSRAWTFQERHLSQRAVYFTGSQMYFTCPHEVVFEDTVPGVLLPAATQPAQLLDRSKFRSQVWSLMSFIWSDPTQSEFPNKTFYVHGMGSQSMSMMTEDTLIPAPIYRAEPAPTHGSGGGTLRIEGETMWKAYSDAVSMYTRRKMSWQTDALNAFCGVSDLLARGVNSAFWHGLPEYCFDQALLWYPREQLVRRTHASASPSWSWAGWEGHTGYRGRGWRNAVAHGPANVVRWFHLRHPRDIIYEYLVNGEPHTPEEIADFAFRAARQPARVVPHNPAELFHLAGAKTDGWTHRRDTDRNEHYYTHASYPGLRFTYPATLPGQKLLVRPAPDGALFFIGQTVPVRFVDIAQTVHDPAPRVDPFLQLGVFDEPDPSGRRPWEAVIYHQGYRAGFLSLNVPISSLDTTPGADPKPVESNHSSPDRRDKDEQNENTPKYVFVAMSRDTLPGIAPPAIGWDAYWGLTPREVQLQTFYDWEWSDEESGKRLPVLGPREEAKEPYRRRGSENGDPYWDQARFGGTIFFDVYNVLMLERKTEDESAWWERVGVGKMNCNAFWHAKPEERMVILR